MAFFKCSSCVFCLMVAGAAGIAANDVAKQLVPNGAQPFSIGVSQAPLAKVIEMLQKIMDQVVQEDLDEQDIFANFACFCKDKTQRLTVHVRHHAGQIDVTSATIADNTAQTNNLRADHKKRTADHTKFSRERDDYTRRLKTENANWDSTLATYKNDQFLIGEALESMKGSKTKVSSAAFLQVSAGDKVKQVLDLAEAMGLVAAPKHRALAASLLQSGKHANPREGYEYHEGSDDVIDLVEDLNGQMQDLHKTQQDEHDKARHTFKDALRGLTRKIKTNLATIDDNLALESKVKKETAEARQVLIENNADLDETDGVLKQITNACESRATEYDTRKAARNQELIALNTAMGCLTNAHGHASKSAGNAALLQLPQPKALPRPVGPVRAKTVEKVDTKVKAKVDVKTVTEAKVQIADKAAPKALSFLQTIQTQSSLAELSSDQRKKMALDVILAEGKRVKSYMLTALGASSAGDPFAKVIQLLTDLRWRLEKEEHAEVDKQIWCTQQVEETTHERDLYFETASTHSVEVVRLDAQIDKLVESVKRHTQRAIEIGKSLTDIYTDISQLSKKQLQAMSIQKIARDEIKEAILILRSYYSKQGGASASALLLQADQPAATEKTLQDFRKERENIRDENDERASNEEGRQTEREKRAKKRLGDLQGDMPSSGRQGSLGDALALMETIVSDFDREIGNLEGDLDAEHKELVESNAVLTSQKEKAEELAHLDTQDLKTARVNRAVKFNDMQESMDLLDIALKGILTLKPTCISTGMSYNERVKMREVEMAALEKALCILGETDAKYGCPQ